MIRTWIGGFWGLASTPTFHCLTGSIQIITTIKTDLNCTTILPDRHVSFY
jgi:hypothetical protein